MEESTEQFVSKCEARIKEKGRGDMEAILATANADAWKESDVYDALIKGVKGYSQYTDDELIDELGDLFTHDFEEMEKAIEREAL